MMMHLIKAEAIKGRHSVGQRLLFFLPLLAALLATILTGGQFSQIGAYNWWYLMFLPVSAALVCISLTESEKKLRFFSISVLPIPASRIWLAKVWTGCCYLLAANLLVFGLTTLTGAFFIAQYPVWRGIAAALLLTVTWIWQVPLGMFLSVRFSSPAAFLGMLGANLVCASQPIAGGSLWLIPFAIPSRLMAPILGINPNGIPLAASSALHDYGVVLPGILINAALFIALLILTTRWFAGREV